LICSREVAAKQPFRSKFIDRINYIEAGDPKEIEKLAETLAFALSDRARLREIGAAGRAVVSAHYAGAGSDDPVITTLAALGCL